MRFIYYGTKQELWCACYSNNRPLDIFGLYREVTRVGGLIANEQYDENGRWIGGINFAGHIFPKLKNYSKDNRATSVGNQLLSNYRKFLYEYERAWQHIDLQDFQADEMVPKREESAAGPAAGAAVEYPKRCLVAGPGQGLNNQSGEGDNADEDDVGVSGSGRDCGVSGLG